MALKPGEVPILRSASAGFSFMSAGFVRVAPLAAAMAAGLVALQALAAAQPILVPFVFTADIIATIAIYAALLRFALAPENGLRLGLGPGEARLFLALAFLALVMIMVSLAMLLVSSMALSSVAAAYEAELNAATGNAAATLALMQKMIASQPLPFLLALLLFGFVWMAMTSRLYLIAPATIESGRARTFETWDWTKGAMLRILAARLLLLGPLFLLEFGAQLFGFGLDQQEGGQPLAVSLAFSFGLEFFIFAVYLPAEAALSVYLYRGLRPPNDH